MVVMLGLNYTINYTQANRIAKFCNNHGGCNVTVNENEYPNYNYTINYALPIVTETIKDNTLTLEIQLNENNVSISNVSVLPSTVAYTYTYDSIGSYLYINIPNLDAIGTTSLNIKITGTKKYGKNNKNNLSIKYSGVHNIII